MKHYMSSMIFLIGTAMVLIGLARELEQFNRDLVKAMFNQPSHTMEVTVSE